MKRKTGIKKKREGGGKAFIRRLSGVLLTVLLLAGLLSGCGGNENTETSEETGKLRIVTSVFPLYDWTREILGGTENEVFSLELLVKNGIDLHSFQPSAEDIVNIAECDLLIFVGGESEAWLRDLSFLPGQVNIKMKVLNLLELLGDRAREEEDLPGVTVEGGAPEEEDTALSSGGALKEDSAEAGDAQEYDEHVWLSLRNAKFFVREITDAICELDEAHREDYRKNEEDYIKRLQELDFGYQKVVSEAPLKTVLFGDRFPFLYLMKDYELNYYAAFPGCSAESEASFETVFFLAEKMDELQLPAVIVIDGKGQKIAEAILKSTENPDRPILEMNSLQSVKPEEDGKGTDYLSVMQENLEVLSKALGE